MKPPTPPPKPTFQFDPEKYAHHVAEMDLTDEQRDQVIQVVANIMRAIVGLGFGISPTQTPCGEDDILGDLIPKVMPDLID